MSMNIGETIQERYRIQRLLGQGSMGMTYKAFDLQTRRSVAVKQLHLARTQEWKTLEMFEREAKILQQLTHPRIPTYIDYFSLDTPEGMQFLLVQEYVEGKTLKQLIEEGWRASETDILDVFLDLVDILYSLHTVCPPVIHRDINPKNIIISSNTDVYPPINDIYLVDFGAVQDRIRTTFLGGTTIVGTFGYVPFEQFSGQAVPASDYYALGATLLYMLTHRHPSEFPTDDLRPQFEPFLHTSPTIIRLLNGLLEPSVKKRIDSPEHIREILEGGVPEILETKVSQVKPVSTKIEKVVESSEHLSFRIPRQKIGFVVKWTVLHLTPKWVQVREEVLGLSSGRLWRVPTAEIQPSDLTRYFKKEGRSKKSQPVLGINYEGETFDIGSQFDKAEIEWLTQEINRYIESVKHQLLVSEHSSVSPDQGFQRTHKPLEHATEPSHTHIKKVAKKRDQLRFHIPNVINREEIADIVVMFLVCLAFTSIMTASALFLMYNSEIGWILGGIISAVAIVFGLMGLGLLFTGFSRLFGSTVISLSPEWIRVGRRCFGVGYSQHIPTAAIHQTDVIRYFYKHKLLLGINYNGTTSKIGAGLSRTEIEWLIQEITNYVATFAKPIPQEFMKADLEMK